MFLKRQRGAITDTWTLKLNSIKKH